MTTLFADLVGFTALCEQIDFEDVDALLRDYFAVARHEIERFGGVVEKYIGDAVVGLFGALVAHEDDPERAVRAALALVEEGSRLVCPNGERCRLRVGVNTGPALVRLDVDPASGVSLVIGDAVNTAARLEQQAAPGQVVVGEITHTMTDRVFTYEPTGPLALKGKTESVRAWTAVTPVSRRGVEPDRSFAGPMVGRRHELAAFRRLFDAALEESRPRFVLLVGEPGVGKSRLVFELARTLEREPGLMVLWRQGRCLALPDAPAYWALADIVRAHAGILETDDAVAAETKLRNVLTPDDVSLLPLLEPLIGRPSGTAAREDNFAAWGRFVAGLASDGPAVLVFEDLHCADEGTLAFLADLPTRVTDVPLLVVCTARKGSPAAQDERLAVDPWAGLDVDSLADDAAAELVGSLMGDRMLTPDSTVAIIERSGGNPLYAEELVRLLLEQGLLVPAGAGLSVDEKAASALPPTLQSLVAARLDQLDAEERELIADAAVVGQVFWPGAVAEMGGRDRHTTLRVLDDLAARGLVRRQTETAVAEEPEYSFWHAVTRDVAYSQLTRLPRARKHAAAAAWMEEHDRAGAAVEVCAHHYGTAVQLAAAGHDRALVEDLREPAIRTLRKAGELALSLDVAAAEQYFARAAALADDSHQRHPTLSVAWAEALLACGRPREAEDVLETTVDSLLATGDRRTAALAKARLSIVKLGLGDPCSERIAEEAAALLEGDEPSSEMAAVLEQLVYMRMARFDSAATVAAADRVLDLRTELGLPAAPRTLAYRGMARCDLGDAGGLEDVRAAAGLAEAQGAGRIAAVMLHNLAETTYLYGGAADALAVRRSGLDVAVRCHAAKAAATLQGGLVEDLMWTGDWNGALALAVELEPELEQRGELHELAAVRSCRALILARQGRQAEALQPAAWAHRTTQGGPDLETRLTSIFAVLVVRWMLGEQGAAGLLEEWIGLPAGVRGSRDYPLRLPQAARIASRLRRPDLIEALTAEVRRDRPLDALATVAVEALVSEGRGDFRAAARQYGEAADGWSEFGVPHESAVARSAQSRCLAAAGETA